MRTGRLEAFSDGVLAIIITIMVLELETPAEPTLHALGQSATGLLTYLLSFVYIGIYWNNHHHMFQLCDRINGTVLWANLNLLFWLSLYPFTTNWMDQSDLARTPVVVYGINLLLAAIAYYVLQQTILRAEGEDSLLRQAIGRDLKGKLSPGDLPARHRVVLRRPAARHRPVRRGGGDVARPRPPPRGLHRRARPRRLTMAVPSRRAVLVVEGASDRVAVETLAVRLGRDLAAEGVDVVELGGATNIGRFLVEHLRDTDGLRLAGLYDAPEERFFARGLERAGLGRSRTAAGWSSSASSPASSTSRTS